MAERTRSETAPAAPPRPRCPPERPGVPRSRTPSASSRTCTTMTTTPWRRPAPRRPERSGPGPGGGLRRTPHHPRPAVHDLLRALPGHHGWPAHPQRGRQRHRRRGSRRDLHQRGAAPAGHVRRGGPHHHLPRPAAPGARRARRAAPPRTWSPSVAWALAPRRAPGGLPRPLRGRPPRRYPPHRDPRGAGRLAHRPGRVRHHVPGRGAAAGPGAGRRRVPLHAELQAAIASAARPGGAFSRYPSTAAAFLPDGRVPQVGEVFRQPQLGHDLPAPDRSREGRRGRPQGPHRGRPRPPLPGGAGPPDRHLLPRAGEPAHGGRPGAVPRPPGAPGARHLP